VRSGPDATSWRAAGSRATEYLSVLMLCCGPLNTESFNGKFRDEYLNEHCAAGAGRTATAQFPEMQPKDPQAFCYRTVCLTGLSEFEKQTVKSVLLGALLPGETPTSTRQGREFEVGVRAD